MHDNTHGSAVNPLPPVIVAIAAIMVGVELVLYAGSQGYIGGADAVGWRIWAQQQFGVNGPLLEWMLETGRFSPNDLARYLVYPFIHAAFSHAAFGIVLLLALGKSVGEVFRPWAVLVVFFGASVMGGLAYSMIGARIWLIGAYPGVFGILGAFTFILFVNLGAYGENRMRAFSLIGMLLFIRLVFGVLFGIGWDWVAEVAAFIVGFGLSFVVCPGGWRRVVSILRQR